MAKYVVCMEFNWKKYRTLNEAEKAMAFYKHVYPKNRIFIQKED